jgi:dolichol-phosphate mannosyltransferase
VRLTVVLPTLNEAGNIPALTERIWNQVPDARIVVSDDGSTDGTRDVVRALVAAGKPILLLARAGRPCLTASIQEGIDAATTPYVAWMDADLSHPPELLPALLRAAEGSGCAIATRFGPGGKQKKSSRDTPDSVLAIALSGILNVLVRRALGLTVTDYTSGFIVVERDVIATHRLEGDYGEYFIELVHHLSRTGVDIVELPYESPPRTWGESKTGSTLPRLVRRGVKYLWLTVRLRLRGSGSSASIARSRPASPT